MWLPPMWIGLSRHCSALSKAREIVTQIASLDGVRGVLRLAGPDIIGFLQVKTAALSCSSSKHRDSL